jgi:hypothetical protein
MAVGFMGVLWCCLRFRSPGQENKSTFKINKFFKFRKF